MNPSALIKSTEAVTSHPTYYAPFIDTTTLEDQLTSRVYVPVDDMEWASLIFVVETHNFFRKQYVADYCWWLLTETKIRVFAADVYRYMPAEPLKVLTGKIIADLPDQFKHNEPTKELVRDVLVWRMENKF